MAAKKKVSQSRPAAHAHSVHSTTANGESTMSPKKTKSHSHRVVASESNVSNATGESPMSVQAVSAQTAPSTSASSSAAAPSAIGVASILGYLASITTALGPDAVPLTINDRRRLLKLRPGGEAHAEPVMAVAKQYGLVLPGVDPAEVDADLALLKQLAPIVQRFDAVRALVGDVVAQAESRVWKATTNAYSTLIRYVPEYPGLQLELAPIASFLAIRFKDAPASLRPQERRALAKARSKRKAGKGAKAAAVASGAAASSTVTAAVATPVTVTPASQTETTVHVPVVSTTVAPSAPVIAPAASLPS